MKVSEELKEKIRTILEESREDQWFANEDGSEYQDEVFDESTALDRIVKLLEEQ